MKLYGNREKHIVRKIVRTILVCLAFSILNFQFSILTSCSKPKIVPDQKLAQIFHDIYLTNAYLNDRSVVNLDSLNIYEPVFSRYGYTSEDIRYTIGNFAKRKSARLGDVVDEAITMLEAENNFYRGRIRILDTVSLIARERYATTVYADSLIEIRRARDTSRLRIVIPVGSGDYNVRYSYFLDSTDHNPVRATHYMIDKNGRRTILNSRRLASFSEDMVDFPVLVSDRDSLLVLGLNGYGKDMTTPALRVENLTVKRFLPDSVALDSMARSLFDYYIDDPLGPFPPIADGSVTDSSNDVE